MIITPVGQNFRELIEQWGDWRSLFKEADDRFARIKMLVDGQDYIFFFVYKGDIYGANETARSVFSVMKRPMGEPGYKDMSFSATNLTKAMGGEPKEEVFVYKEVHSLKVIEDKEDVYKMLLHPKVKHKGEPVDDKMKDIRVSQQSRSKDGRIQLTKDFKEL